MRLRTIPVAAGLGILLALIFVSLAGGCAAPHPTTVDSRLPTSPHAWAVRHLQNAQVTAVKVTSPTTWDAKVDGVLVHFEKTADRGVEMHLHVPTYTPTEGYR
jgi:hypothetical protein